MADNGLDIPDPNRTGHSSWHAALGGLLRAHWKTAAGITGACVAAAIAAIVLQEPVYEARVTVGIGKFAKLGRSYPLRDPNERHPKRKESVELDPPMAIEHPDEAIHRLIAEGTESGKGGRRGAKSEAYFHEARRVKDAGPNAVEIVTRGTARKEALALAERAAADLVARHEVTYQDYRTKVQAMIDATQKTIQKLETAGAPGGIRSPTTSLEESAAHVLRSLLDERLARLEQLLQPPFGFPTSVVSKADAAKTPVAPRPGLYLAIALFVGLVLSFVTATMSEWLANLRQAMRRP